MGTLDQIKEINLLKNKISELEAKIQNKDNDFTAFGRSYSKVGSSDSDFLIRTKGQVKIQWGSKFIDLIKDGKINVDSKFIYKESQVGVKDGIYIIGDETNYQVILKIGDQKLNLKDSTGNAYISFQEEQHTNAEQKYTALTNIGFLYKSIDEIDTNSLQNGIIYIESDQKLYIVQNGTLSEFTVSFPSPYNKYLLWCNPIAYFIESSRNAILYAKPINYSILIVWTFIGLIVSVIGINTINKYENSYVKVIK